MSPPILGIDVASRKLDLCWGPETHACITYTTDALDTFLQEHPEIDPTAWIVGMESTGDYHIAAAKYFLERGYTVKILNPLLTKQYTRATIRGTKTDRTDAYIIHKLIAEGNGDAIQLTALLDAQKELIRLERFITKCASQMTLRIQSTKRKSIPGTEEALHKAEEVLGVLKTFSKELTSEMTAVPSHNEILIDSIPGFAEKLSAIVAHELGDITRFKNAKSLVPYAGLDPRIKQSGTTLNTHGKLTKRGSSYLRAALFLAANAARRSDPELMAYYTRKRGEGRTHKEVLCIISRKLLYRIHAVLTAQRPYEVRPLTEI